MARDTQVLVFASQKGGAGKTTLSSHIAVEAERVRAGPVALVDTDPQGSLAIWSSVRGREAPAFAEASVSDLEHEIHELSEKGFRYIIVDTPPALTSSIAEIISVADLVVVPIRPSPHDLRSVGPTIDMIERRQKPLVFVVNAATARSRITEETTDVLSQHGTVAPVILHQRIDFAASMIDGRTVGEVDPASNSGNEIAGLWAFLADRLRLGGGAAMGMQVPRPTLVQDAPIPAYMASETVEPAAWTADWLSIVHHPGPEPVVTALPVPKMPVRRDAENGSGAFGSPAGKISLVAG